MANEGYHEAIEELSDETRDMHRAITSLMEELEAVDWYNQRVDACKDSDLKSGFSTTVGTKKSSGLAHSIRSSVIPQGFPMRSMPLNAPFSS